MSLPSGSACKRFRDCRVGVYMVFYGSLVYAYIVTDHPLHDFGAEKVGEHGRHYSRSRCMQAA